MPAVLLGDRLPYVHVHVGTKELNPFAVRTHFQRELFTLDVEDGEKVKVLPQEVQFDATNTLNIQSIVFRRWPRDPIRNPVKLRVPLIIINEEAVPLVRNGGYVHNMFATGLLCHVRDPEHVPRFVVADMKKHVGGDIRFDAVELPPGVTVIPNHLTRLNDGNFLLGRAKRIKGG